MLPHVTYDARHWRRRAEEMRTLASTVKGDGARDAMLRIAEHYDRLAARTEAPIPLRPFDVTVAHERRQRPAPPARVLFKPSEPKLPAANLPPASPRAQWPAWFKPLDPK